MDQGEVAYGARGTSISDSTASDNSMHLKLVGNLKPPLSMHAPLAFQQTSFWCDSSASIVFESVKFASRFAVTRFARAFYSFVTDSFLSIWSRSDFDSNLAKLIKCSQQSLEGPVLHARQSSCTGELALVMEDFLGIHDGITASRGLALRLAGDRVNCVEWMPNGESLLIGASNGHRLGHVHVLHRLKRAKYGTLMCLYETCDGVIIDMRGTGFVNDTRRAKVALLLNNSAVQVAEWGCFEIGEAFEVLHKLPIMPTPSTTNPALLFDWSHDVSTLIIVQASEVMLWKPTPTSNSPIRLLLPSEMQGTAFLHRINTKSLLGCVSSSKISMLDIFSATIR